MPRYVLAPDRPATAGVGRPGWRRRWLGLISLLLGIALAAPAAAASTAEEQAAISQINFRRVQIGLPALSYNADLEQSARGHANYLAVNDCTGHLQRSSPCPAQSAEVPGSFTGATLPDRISATYGSHAVSNEVISFGASTGVAAIEGLIQAIYHRFGIFSSSVREAGVGVVTNHPTYGTVVVVNSALKFASPPSPSSWVGVYPYSGQTGVPRDFLSDSEAPDPVSGANKVGYPVSIHVDDGKTLSVSAFEIKRVGGGGALDAQLLSPGDPNVPSSAAALIPRLPLDYDTQYEVNFSGTADGVPLTRTWRFGTAPLLPITFSPAQPYLGYNSTVDIQVSGGSGTYTGATYSPASVADVVFTGPNTLRVISPATGQSLASSGTVTINVTDDEGHTGQVVVQVQPTVDAIPDAFSFPAVTGAPLSTLVTSAAITVSGIDVPTAISITGGGEYSITGVNGGAFTSQAGTVVNGNTVRVRLTSAATGVATTSATLTIGGVGANFTVTTLDTLPPSVPAGLVISNLAANSLTLSWTASIDNVGVTAYQVFRGGVFRATVTGSTSFSDTGLASVTLYSYTVAACDAAGLCSGPSLAVSATTFDNVPPSPPAGLSVTNLAANSLTLNWGAAADNVAVTAYQVFRGGVFRATVAAPASSFNDGGLTSATLYIYTVAACDAAGYCSAQSAPFAVTTPDNVPPSVPASLTATAVSGTRIDLAWSASSDNVGVTAYQVFRGGVFRATVNAPAGSFSDSGLTNGTTYSYAVRACDAAGNCSAPSSATFAATPDTQAPSVPSGLTAAAVSGSQINLAWSAATDNLAVTAYQVFRDGVLRATVGATTTSFSNTGLTASTSYSYTVAACDAVGNCSAPSAVASATTLAAGNASFTPLLKRGWSLMGNSVNVTLNAETVFGSASAPITGVTSHINSVWKWNADSGRWQFYAPNETAEQNLAIAKQNQFGVLASIEPGMGYWVKVESSAPVEGVTLLAQAGAMVSFVAADTTAGTPAKIAGRSLITGWQLVAIADELTPSQFNEALSGTPQQSGTVKSSFQTLWAWDAAKGKWYYYDSQLERDGVAASQGLELVKQYATGNSFLHFEDWSKTLGVGAGFWMRK